MFFNCDQVINVWTTTKLWHKVSYQMFDFESANELIFSMLDTLPSWQQQCIFAMSLWCIWKHRNNRVWKDKDPLATMSVIKSCPSIPA